MSVIQAILNWSEELQLPWVRDALRRIVTQPQLSDDDVEELTHLCKRPHGLSESSTPAVPLDATHLPSGSAGGAVTLTDLTHIADVNALAPNEKLPFGKTGITVIYGDNGAGKSGYSRILRRACRARGNAEAVLANALSDKPAGTPTARLRYEVGGIPDEHVWKDGAPGSAALAAVSVFDATAANVYVSDRTDVRFRPLGLDVFDRLASTCAKVKARLEDEKSRLASKTVTWPPLPSGSEGAKLIANLTALTPRDLVDRVATLSSDEEAELQRLTAVLAAARLEDPTKKGKELRTKAERLRRLVGEIRSLAAALGPEALRRLAEQEQEAASAVALAEEASRELASDAALKGFGSQEWRAMWEASRDYSIGVAYPTESFPHTGHDVRCVLCQQDLDTAATTRLQKFERFVQGTADAMARQKKAAFQAAKSAILGLRPGELSRDGLDDLATLNTAAHDAASSFLDQARQVQAAVREGSELSTSLGVGPLAELEALAEELEQRASEMTKAADPTTRKQSEARHAELAARSALTGLRKEIHEEIDRKARLNAIETCIKDTDTRALTKLSTELTKKHVTDALTASFLAELKRLGFTALELELRAVSAQKGVLYHQVQLRHATKADLQKVVSEGEGRCIALAAFLAEIGRAEHPSAIIFDDPVSSLAHRWRGNVARRLVEEARARQVVVFTHDIVFLAKLIEDAEALDVDCVAETIERGSDYLAGHVDQGLPWNGMSTSKRLGALRAEWQVADKLHRDGRRKEYEREATRLYANLRRTWERAVEEILLNQAVVRFRLGVETQRLKKVADITQADIDAVEAGMTKCSKWEGGHDQAEEVNEPVPAPDKLKTDIDALDAWVKSIATRRK